MKQSVNLLLSIILLVGAVTIAASSEPKPSTSSSSSLLRKGVPDEDGAAKQPKRNLQLFGDGGGILDAIFGGDDDDDDDEVPSDNGGTNSTDDDGDDEEDGGLLDDGDFNLTESIEGIVDAVQNVTDGIIDDEGDEDDEDSEGILDGLLDWNSTDEGDGLFDEGLLDGDFNVTDIISNISDAFKNFTDGDGSGIFGDWNLTGDGDGIFGGDFNLTEVIQNITDGFNLTDGIFGDGLFNLTDGIFGGDGLFNLTDGIFGELFNRTGGADALLTPGLIDTWIEDAVVDEDQVCTSTSNDTDVPACLSPMGAEGFWVCRTLTNPFTGEPSSQTVCIGDGRFLSNNDECGCCEPEGCPTVCDCTCDNDGEGDGVLIQTSSPLFGNMTVCVDPRYAVSAIAHSNNEVSCDTSCSSD